MRIQSKQRHRVNPGHQSRGTGRRPDAIKKVLRSMLILFCYPPPFGNREDWSLPVVPKLPITFPLPSVRSKSDNGCQTGVQKAYKPTFPQPRSLKCQLFTQKHYNNSSNGRGRDMVTTPRIWKWKVDLCVYQFRAQEDKQPHTRIFEQRYLQA